MTTALLIAGHGSTENPDSSAPTRYHAEEIRKRGIFDEVVCAFWKEEPGFQEACDRLESSTVYVVPNFISEGYFTREVIPRELSLDPNARTTLVNGRRIHYCKPVGSHLGMTDLLLKNASKVAPGIPPEETTLLLIGHGTKLNSNSRVAVETQVERIRQHPSTVFAAVRATYMEESPLISEWDTLGDTPYFIVVPFFISDGLHSNQDIPVLLGIEDRVSDPASQRDIFRGNPYHLRGRELYYSPAIGSDPSLADIILDQVIAFGSD